MTDYQRVVDELRSFLQSNDQSQTDLLRELVVSYAAHCRTANDRLRRCEEFLRKGLRSEAIQFAQSEPSLLELVTVLDFPERRQLDELLEFYGIPVPPHLQMATAEALNEAYSHEQPLEGLLREHRRLALARAPLPKRLEVMRKIAQLDVQSPVWTQDIGVFEEARVQELQTTVTRAASRGELAPVAEIAQELSQGGWLNPPPTALCQEVQRLAKQFADQLVRADLEGILGLLHGAVASNDLEKAMSLRNRFKAVLARSALTSEDPVVRRAERPLNWVVQQERRQIAELDFQTALTDLEGALNDSADPDEVARLYDAVLTYRRAIPAALKQRCHAYISRADHSRAWRERAFLFAVLLIGMAVLLAIFGYLWLQGRGG